MFTPIHIDKPMNNSSGYLIQKAMHMYMYEVPRKVRGYTISYGVATPSRRIVIEGVNTNSFTLNRLEPDTDYVFAVGAYNEADGEDGEPVLLSARTLPSDVLGAVIFAVTYRYGIYQSEQLSKMRSNSRNVKLTGLLPGKEYEIAVKVVGDDGRESPWSIRDIVLTPPDPSKEVSRYDWECDFEKDLCGMRNGDGVHWIRSGGTPAAESGNYSVIDASVFEGAAVTGTLLDLRRP
ncbi:fibronectin type III domain protein [Teladorsagia circumcincta]|uniref:Fibronectin type III domain protein n=1 Tax=Teladorsagia circumcincta TaxID=45464 RepID=A0A2G9V0M2_TELCI|nr:fibronectin type III domain protein [Teladorsagia circumcincta]